MKLRILDAASDDLVEGFNFYERREQGIGDYFLTCLYHCQQAAEKAIKAWLTASEVVFPKTHSLEILLRLCFPSALGLQGFLLHASELTPFATEFRYPGNVFEPSAGEARNALMLAEELTSWITGEIDKIPRPDANANP